MTGADLAAAVKTATRRAYSELLRRHPERFYYFTLVTTDEAHPPTVAAWSEEALDRAVAAADDPADARFNLEWSYADSPYLCFGTRYFAGVRRLYARRPEIDSLDEDGWEAEYDFRLDASEQALRELSDEGLFGVGAARDRIYVNAEVMPPDRTNTERARRINPPAAIETWLAEAAEE